MTAEVGVSTSGGHSSRDPFPWGGYSEPLGTVPMVEAGALTMMFRYGCAEGSIGERGFIVDAGIDGSLWVRFPNEPNHADGTKGRSFVIRPEDAVRAAEALLDAEAAMRDGG